MKSKFTFKSYFVLIMSIILACLIIFIIPAFFDKPYYDDKIFPKLFLPSILTFTLIYLVIGEIRTKCIIVEININKIKVKRFLGIINNEYNPSEITGWKYSHLSSRGGTYEYLYLYSNNRKVIKISEFYHKNYLDLKNKIEKDFKFLGYEEFSLKDEFIEIFK